MASKKSGIGEEKGRWSSRKKMDAVMRLLKGEDLDSLSRELRVNAATPSSWREVFLANGLAGLKSREVDARDEKIGALQKALGSDYQYVEPQVGSVYLQPGDMFLLCSDGLTEGLFDSQLAERLMEARGGASENPIAPPLVRAALEAAGGDNITALVVEVL